MLSLSDALLQLPSFMSDTDNQGEFGEIYDWIYEMCGNLTDKEWDEVFEVFDHYCQTF
jgi:hypothetical protein